MAIRNLMKRLKKMQWSPLMAEADLNIEAEPRKIISSNSLCEKVATHQLNSQILTHSHNTLKSANPLLINSLSQQV